MRIIFIATTCLLAIAAPLAAHAQQAEQSTGADEGQSENNEIIVTGLRVLDSPLMREEVSATSLKEAAFRFSGSTRRIDVLRSVPGLTVMDLGNRSTIVIRGMATAPDSDPNGSAVQSYIGGVALSGLGGSRENADISNYDIERIDVLRGPQGFSFGGGALSGVVRTVPRAADPSGFSAYAAGTVRTIESGRNFGWETDGFINVPIVQDKLAVRLTAYANREESPYSSAEDFRQSSPGRAEGGRLSIRYQPSDALTIDLRYLYDDHKLPDLSRSVIPLGDYVTNDFREDESMRTHLLWGEANWDMGFATLTYIGSYGRTKKRDDYFSPFYTTADFDLIEIRTDERSRSTTQELRLSQQDGSGLDWVVGAYFEKRRRNSAADYYILGTDTPGPILSFFDPTLPDLSGEVRVEKQEQRSAFGEVSYWITPEVKLTGGTRYHWYKQTNSYAEVFVDGTPPTDPGDYDLIPAKGQWWWKANVTWTPSDRQLYYLQVARAARPGGSNYNQDPSCPAEYMDRITQFYDGDAITTYEAGAKMSDLGGFATINASAYYSHWKNAPLYTVFPCAFDTSFIDNTGMTELYGVEFEATLRLSRDLSTTLTATWADSRIAKIDATFTGGEVGERMPGNPRWKLGAAIDYSTPLSDDVRFFAGGRVDYTGRYKNGTSVDWSYFAAFTTFPGLEGVEPIGTFPSGVVRYSDPGSGGYTLVGLRLGFQSDDWTASLFADNILDSHKRSIVNVLDFTPSYDATITRVTPRTIGLRVERRF